MQLRTRNVLRDLRDGRPLRADALINQMNILRYIRQLPILSLFNLAVAEMKEWRIEARDESRWCMSGVVTESVLKT